MKPQKRRRTTRPGGDVTNENGYTSPGAILDEGELNSGKLHLTWEVPYEPGTLEVKAYNADGSVAATDSITTSSTPYTIQAQADKTVLAADGSSLAYVECTVVDEEGNMVPNADNLIKFETSGAVSIFGVDNGQQENEELYKYGNVESSDYSERSAYKGKVLVILKSEKEAGDALLTVSSEKLKPVQVALKVTEDGTGTAPEVPAVTGTEISVDPIAVTVPSGMEVTLPSAVTVNYESTAGVYSVVRSVTWGEVENGRAEGRIDGSALTAIAVITEDAGMETDAELATNTSLGANNATFRLSELSGEEAEKALATATFTGDVNNYPNNMLDGDETTSWTNAYSRSATRLLPEITASRKSEYVTFYWNSSKVMNQITLSFKENSYMAIPEEVETEYWDGDSWEVVQGQKTLKESGKPVVMQFTPVYTDKIRVYMENGTPYTTTGNMEITEASVKLSTEVLEVPEEPENPDKPDDPVKPGDVTEPDKSQPDVPQDIAQPEGQTPSEPEQKASVGQVFVSGDYTYQVTSVTAGTVQVTGLENKSLTAVKVYNTVSLEGKKYKVTSVAASAFKGNKKIKTAVIGLNVTTIGSNAFSGCTNLKKITVGKRVTTIKKKAFYNCKKLTRVVIRGKSLKNVRTSAFKKTAAQIVVRVPKALTKKRRAALLNKLKNAGIVKRAVMK